MMNRSMTFFLLLIAPIMALGLAWLGWMIRATNLTSASLRSLIWPDPDTDFAIIPAISPAVLVCIGR